MTIVLEKFLLDVKKEKALWQSQDHFKTEEKETAWKNIAFTNKMTVGYAKSTFNVLVKKYQQEKSRGNSNWALLEYIDFLDRKNEEEISNNEEENDENIEEDEEFIELLEVTEDCDFESKENSGDEDNIEPSMKSSNITKNKDNEKKKEVSTEHGHIKKGYQKPQLNKLDSQELVKILKAQKQKHENSPQSNPIKPDLHKFPGLTIHRSSYPPQAKISKSGKQIDAPIKPISDSTELATVKKLPPFENFLKRRIVPASAAAVIENGKSQQLHQIIDADAPPSKRIAKDIQEKLNMKKATILTETQIKSEQNVKRSESEGIKKEKEFRDGSISAIKSDKKTINDLKSKIAQVMNNNNSSHRNNFQRNEEIDSENDSEETSTEDSTNSSIGKKVDANNCSNELLLPKFFQDLYKSKTYDSFGMYISSTLNRLPLNLAKKLELKILESILEINSMNAE